MAGHSKWANIKRRKAAVDNKKGKVFTRLIREITVAARAGGPDKDSNPRLRKAVDDALNENMTKDTIDRAILRGSGEASCTDLQEVTYEGYGPCGVAILVNCLTDNRNRTVSLVRHAFTKYGGNLGTDGSVSYLFESKGIFVLPAGTDAERLLEEALNGGADDVVIDSDDSITVFSAPEQFSDLKQHLLAQAFAIDYDEVTLLPSSYITITEPDKIEQINTLLSKLDDIDDVQQVYSNEQI